VSVPSRRALLLGAVPVLLLVAIAAWYWWPSRAAGTSAAVGMVRTTEIRIAPEISGRLARFLVEPGQTVQRGQPVAVLSNPELWAAVGAARAQVDKAQSDRDRVYAGVRDEQVQALQREIEKARAAHTQAQQELARKSALAARSDASQQELDTATAQEASSRADIAAAEARYAEAQRGPTPEERALADATVVAAKAASDVVEARAAKMLLHAPAAGTVAILVAEVGEAVVPGEPVLTLVPDNGTWFGFSLREDALHGLAIGSVIPVHTSAQAEPISAKLVELRDWGEFAVWRAARATGDHDLNTLFLRLDPVTAAARPAAGETVWFDPIAGAHP
jgi:HlyD family secretion protein